MGYNTNFDGSWKLNKPLDKKMKDFLTKFAEARHMKRDLTKIMSKDEAKKYGDEGWLYVDGGRYEYDNPSIVDYNVPPTKCPDLWCQWLPNDDGTEIVWDGGEKFYAYVEWIELIVKEFLAPNGYVLNGTVYWEGDDEDDCGRITITDNEIEVVPLDP